LCNREGAKSPESEHEQDGDLGRKPDPADQRATPGLGLLFLKSDAKSTRLRIAGRARIDESQEAIAGLPGAKPLIRAFLLSSVWEIGGLLLCEEI
jgi:hypothetical protein